MGRYRRSGRSLGQVCSDDTSSHVGILRVPARARPSPLRVSAAGCGGFIFSPASTCSIPCETICCLQLGWSVGFESTKQPPIPKFSFWLQTGLFFMLVFCLLPPCLLPALPQVFWMRSFERGLILPSASSFNPGRIPECWEGTRWDVTRGCSQGCPGPSAGWGYHLLIRLKMKT